MGKFHELFMGKYFLATTRHAKAQEFLELKQETMTVMEYMAKFIELARFSDDYVVTDMTIEREIEDARSIRDVGDGGKRK